MAFLVVGALFHALTAGPAAVGAPVLVGEAVTVAPSVALAASAVLGHHHVTKNGGACDTPPPPPQWPPLQQILRDAGLHLWHGPVAVALYLSAVALFALMPQRRGLLSRAASPPLPRGPAAARAAGPRRRLRPRRCGGGGGSGRRQP